MNLQNSLAGWNVSHRADRSSPERFLETYLERFPERKRWIKKNYDQALGISYRLLQRNPKVPTVEELREWGEASKCRRRLGDRTTTPKALPPRT